MERRTLKIAARAERMTFSILIPAFRLFQILQAGDQNFGGTDDLAAEAQAENQAEEDAYARAGEEGETHLLREVSHEDFRHHPGKPEHNGRDADSQPVYIIHLEFFQFLRGRDQVAVHLRNVPVRDQRGNQAAQHDQFRYDEKDP